MDWLFSGDFKQSSYVDDCIDNGVLVTNDMILTELIPVLEVKGEGALVELLSMLNRFPMAIDWKNLVEMQVACIQKGINAVGIPDLIICQYAIQYGLSLHSLDKHFRLMAKIFPVDLITAP